MNLSGSLKEGGSSSASIDEMSGVPTISLQDESDSILAFAIDTVEQYTDELKNKSRVEITAAEIAGGTYTASQPFTDYALAANDLPTDSTDITIEGSGFLANLLIDGETFTIHNFNAAGLNVTLSGKHITVDGILQAANIRIDTQDDDTTFSIPVDDMIPESDTLDTLPIDDETTVDISIMDIVSTASVTLAAGASLLASGSVTISAVTSQTHPLIPVLGTGFNMIDVKVGIATITILGTIVSGGNVDVTAKTTITAEASNSSLAKFFVPLAVGVIVANAQVTIGENASITAVGSITILSQTKTSLIVRSTAGKLPISLAVSVMVANCTADVLGDLTSQTGSISIKAAGSTTVQTIASNKAPQTTSTTTNTGTNTTGGTGGTTSSGNTFGGFFAISVVLQNVQASVGGDATLNAFKNISIQSEALEQVTTRATSADPITAGAASASSSDGSMSQVLTIVKQLFTKVKAKLTGESADALGQGSESLNGVDGYTITAETNAHASITTPSKVKAGETATVKVTPDEGYILEALSYTYLPAGQQAYVTKTIDVSGGTGSYTFVMPEAAVTLVALVRERTADDPDDEPLTGNLFDEDEGDGSGVEDVFGNGTAGSEEDEVETPADPGDTYAITISPDIANGALVVGTQRADAGIQIVITVNPSANYQLKADTLKASALLDGRTSVQTIVPNSAGQYVLTMPAGDVVLSAEFEEVPAGTTTTTGGTSKSSAQVTGALAVSVSSNKNKAFIDTTGSITAGGTLAINAAATTQTSLLADGSPVGRVQRSRSAGPCQLDGG